MFPVTSEDPNAAQRASSLRMSLYEDLGCGSLGTTGNMIWLLLSGWWLALRQVILAVRVAIMIIGIPLARLGAPEIGRALATIVIVEEAEVFRGQSGE